MKSAVTLDDVARLAGVSPKTVSRVINGEAYVKNATQEAVHKAIAELGYRPNLAARSLAAARSFLIGLIGTRLDAEIFNSIHLSGLRACEARGLHLIAEELVDVDEESLRHLENRLRQMRFEGVIVSQISDQSVVLDLLEQLNVPYVRIMPTGDADRSDYVTSDFRQGANLLAEHLWTLGHRRIAIAQPNEHWSQDLRQALIAHGCAPDNVLALPLHWQKSPVEAGRDLAAEWLAMTDRPTAIHAFDDQVAAGLISYAWAHGIHVPRDLSVTGFDDSAIANTIWPPITTVRQPFDEMMRASVNLLAEPTKDGKPREVICPVQLIVRESTAMPNDGKIKPTNIP